MSAVTADTITDEQIEALRVEAANAGDIRVATDCTGALLPGPRARRGLLRERCASAYNRYADAINARAKAGQP